MSLATTNGGSGQVVASEQLFTPWGQVRTGGIGQTTHNYTGQRLDSSGLLYYHARYYDPALARFISADSVVPGAGALTATPHDATAQAAWAEADGGPATPQALMNRYSYVLNNPVNDTDSTGHCSEYGIGSAICGGGGGGGTGGAGGGKPATTPAKPASNVPPANTGGKTPATSGNTKLYRSMKSGQDGLPEVGSSARQLGTRPSDISVDKNGQVHPETDGMSVSPNSPSNLPAHRRPPAYGGTSNDSVYCIDVCDLGPNLKYRPDPKNPSGHGFVEPARSMSNKDYQHAIEETRTRWRNVR